MSQDNAPLLETPLAAEHRALGAKMTAFAGWDMPVQYSEGILAEHTHTRTAVSLFDICHMGEFRVTGPGAEAALDHALARAVAGQKPGSCRYNFLLNESGGILDDLIVYRISETEFYLVVNAGTRENDADIFRERIGKNALFRDESAETAKLDLQGPRAAEILRGFGFDPAGLPGYYKFIRTEFNGADCLLSRTGYTGELGFELYFSAEHAVRNWRELLSREGVKPAGLGARDTLRLEMGYSLYGHELNPDTTPLEAGAGDFLKLDASTRDFVGAAALRTRPIRKILTGLRLEGRRAARAGDAVFANGREAGRVTSGAFAPSVGSAVAIAYLEPGCLAASEFEIRPERGIIRARRSAFPFYTGGTAREKI